MPVKSKKPCKKIGCGNLVTYPHRYCDNHKQIELEENAERNSFYDRYVRDKKSYDFYHSVEWIKLRQFVLSKYKGLDLYEYYVNNKIIFATTVHHIIEIKEDWNKGLEISNLLPVSEATHNTIHAMYKNNKKQTQMLLFSFLKRWNNEMG